MAINQMFRSKVARIGIGLMITVFGANQLAAETKVPNEFTSGTPAKASEVNENFSDLNSKIEAISKPESSYSVLSTETLDNGLVRTKLYAYEKADYTAKYYDRDGAFTIDGFENFVNALGTFRAHWTYSVAAVSYTQDEKETRGITEVTEVLAGGCPDGSGIARQPTDELLYVLSMHNSRGGFIMSNQGSTQATDAKTKSTPTELSKAGVYYGCTEGVEYYYLEGTGVGQYSCIDRVAYYGAYTGYSNTWSKATAPKSQLRPKTVVGVFDSSNNGNWGTYYLEIDAPADCLLDQQLLEI